MLEWSRLPKDKKICIRWRKNIRFKLEEITVGRVYDAAMRRAKEIPHLLTWNGNSVTIRKNRLCLERFKGIHAGKRCFIIGNGPSLGHMDLSPLENEFTIGMNRIYLLFEKMLFSPTYYVCINELVLEQFSTEIQSLDMPKFLNWNRRNYFRSEDENTMFLRVGMGLSDSFEGDSNNVLSSGGTVTYASLQLAYYMGFDEVILIGVDHNYVEKGRPNKTEIRSEERDESHFHPDYFAKGIKWQLPDLLRSELAYALARKSFEKQGRRVIDATVGGKCEVFEKKNFVSLFNNVDPQ